MRIFYLIPKTNSKGRLRWEELIFHNVDVDRIQTRTLPSVLLAHDTNRSTIAASYTISFSLIPSLTKLDLISVTTSHIDPSLTRYHQCVKFLTFLMDPQGLLFLKALISLYWSKNYYISEIIFG